MEELRNVDFHGESTFDIVKILSFFRSFYQYTGWKFSAWSQEALDIYWPQLSTDHDDVGQCLPLDENALLTLRLGPCIHQRAPFILWQTHGKLRSPCSLESLQLLTDKKVDADVLVAYT